ncbi:hypothetical protein [Paenibacillus qinlingensis]|uniref:hypothetical protein n=1 Tax=Paenibacillus qinlingensis TaxID=1837343 RepID=UPI0030B8FED5
MKEIVDTNRINQYLSQFGLENALPEGLRQHLTLFRFESEEALCLQGEEPPVYTFSCARKGKSVYNLNGWKNITN